VRDAYSSYLAARSALTVNQQDVVEPAKESLSLIEKAFMAGKMDLLSLSVVERQVLDARMSYLDAWFGLVGAAASLEVATGE
jgi:cobalt-zinc-cadmium efflux system outer membrane protein